METKKLLKSKSKNVSDWYNDVVLKAELADYAPVKGCMVIRPYGYALWEQVQQYMDKLIKDRGVENSYFPMFIPMSYLEKEKDHVEGFSPQLAVVTHGGGKKLAENLAVRPTSETIMYEMFKRWTGSWKQLPILLNQWCNIVRWEKRTYMFLRTTEFLWQEGHCAHLTHQDSMDQVLWAINMYKKTYNELMAVFGFIGTKSESEKFAGGQQTYTFESLMPGGKSLQACTSHDLGQNFSKSWDWTVQDEKGKSVYPWQNSWGFSTRSIGGMILAHGDDDGLIMPPNIAPVQLVVVPIPGQELNEYLTKITSQLSGYRIKVDQIEGETAGFKFNKWELKGVPIRIEVGQKEAKNNQVTVFRRDTKQKQTISLNDLSKYIQKLVIDIQHKLLEKHQKFTQDNTHSVDSFDEFKKIMAGPKGYIKAFWCGNRECENEIKYQTKASTRCLPINSPKESGKCIFCGKQAVNRWLFAQSY